MRRSLRDDAQHRGVVLSTDPIDLKLGADGDLQFGPDGDLQLSSGLDGVAQSGGVAVRLIRGEVAWDLDAGVPYFEREGVTADEALLGQKFDEDKAIAAISGELLQAPGIESVAAVSVDFDGGTSALTTSWSATTSFTDTPPDLLATGVA